MSEQENGAAMERIVALDEHVEYYWKRSESWEYFGSTRWWEVFITVLGYNGVGGYWLKEEWRWNGNNQTVRDAIKSLGYTESAQITKEVREAIKQ